MKRFNTILTVALALAALAAGCPGKTETVTVTSYLNHDARFPLISGTLRLMEGEITGDIALRSASTYLIRGTFFIRSGASLTIPAGTTIYGEKATNGTLVVSQGGKLYAIGTQDAPVVFTSAQTTRAPGDWGGLILNGKATINVTSGGGATAEGEGDTGTYGGTDDDDCSGALMFVRVEFAGILYSPDNELNGIALQACGNETLLRYIQVHRNDDDGLEWFGGTADAKYVVISGCEDDHIDWTHGANFRLQYAVVDCSLSTDGERGIEADNYEFGEDNTPRSHGVLSNITFVGFKTGTKTSREAVMVRRGTQASIYNCIISGWPRGLRMDSASTATNANDSVNSRPYRTKLTFERIVFYDTTSLAKNLDIDSATAGDQVPAGVAWNTNWFTTGSGATLYDNETVVSTPYSTLGSDKYTTTYVTSIIADPRDWQHTTSNDEWFELPTFVGGVGPEYYWLAGWTSFPTS